MRMILKRAPKELNFWCEEKLLYDIHIVPNSKQRLNKSKKMHPTSRYVGMLFPFIGNTFIFVAWIYQENERVDECICVEERVHCAV